MNTLTGDKLNSTERAKVLAQYVHRWTHENAQRTYQGRCPACEQSFLGNRVNSMTRTEWHAYHVPLILDADWLARTEFKVTKTGNLDTRTHFCVTHTENWKNNADIPATGNDYTRGFTS